MEGLGLESPVAMIGIWKVRISIRVRKNNSFHNEAEYMTDALFLSYFSFFSRLVHTLH